MNGTGFRNYYLNATKVGKVDDVNNFFIAWRNTYGCCFDDSRPWNADPAYRVPKICTRIKTRMLSMDCDANTATRVIKAFKKWYADTYPDG